MHTPEQIKLAIADLHLLTEDQLIFNWKCANSNGSKLYKPFLDAIEKELRKRRKVTDNEQPEVPSKPDLS